MDLEGLEKFLQGVVVVRSGCGGWNRLNGFGGFERFL